MQIVEQHVSIISTYTAFIGRILNATGNTYIKHLTEAAKYGREEIIDFILDLLRPFNNPMMKADAIRKRVYKLTPNYVSVVDDALHDYRLNYIDA